MLSLKTSRRCFLLFSSKCWWVISLLCMGYLRGVLKRWITAKCYLLLKWNSRNSFKDIKVLEAKNRWFEKSINKTTISQSKNHVSTEVKIWDISCLLYPAVTAISSRPVFHSYPAQTINNNPQMRATSSESHLDPHQVAGH